MITNVAQNVLIKAFLILESRMFLIRETCSGVYLRLKFHYLIQNHNEGISKIPIQNFRDFTENARNVYMNVRLIDLVWF